MASDAVMSRWRRAGYAALSGLTGWLVGQIACLPVNLIIAVRDTEGQAKLFVQTLLYGSLAWGGWTLFLATVAWLLVVLPLVMTIRPCLLVRLRFAISIGAALVALSLAATRPAMFRDVSATSLFHKFALVLPYGVFAVSFTLVTAWMYILLSKRRLDRAEAQG
jgi:hypothetical protein